jgi:hypothetical protein
MRLLENKDHFQICIVQIVCHFTKHPKLLKTMSFSKLSPIYNTLNRGYVLNRFLKDTVLITKTLLPNEGLKVNNAFLPLGEISHWPEVPSDQIACMYSMYPKIHLLAAFDTLFDPATMSCYTANDCMGALTPDGDFSHLLVVPTKFTPERNFTWKAAVNVIMDSKDFLLDHYGKKSAVAILLHFFDDYSNEGVYRCRYSLSGNVAAYRGADLDDYVCADVRSILSGIQDVFEYLETTIAYITYRMAVEVAIELLVAAELDVVVVRLMMAIIEAIIAGTENEEAPAWVQTIVLLATNTAFACGIICEDEQPVPSTPAPSSSPTVPPGAPKKVRSSGAGHINHTGMEPRRLFAPKVYERNDKGRLVRKV